MASMVYSNAKQLFLSAGLNLGGTTTPGPIYAALVSGSYSPQASDVYWSTPSADVIGTPVELTGISLTGGVFSAYAATFPSVASGTVANCVVYANTGTASTSPLICVFEGLNQVANGGTITVDWNGTATASVAGELFAL
jgi:hypothetical protein